jgi:hypothetical protein
VVVVVKAILIPIVVIVPVVIMFEAATISVPVTRIKLLSIMARLDPTSALIGWPRPVTVMPFIVVADRIPVTAYPCESRART